LALGSRPPLKSLSRVEPIINRSARVNEQNANAGGKATELRIRCRRGVYRFKSFEEADQWMADHTVLVRKASAPEK
jgi:hypothetical protein